jgi:hypothetical protein
MADDRKAIRDGEPTANARPNRRKAFPDAAARRGTAYKMLHTFSSVGRFIRHESAAAWPVFLFFLTGFLLLLLLIKLALANFAIEMSAFPKAVVGALLAAKAALVLDGTSLARHLEQYRRIVAVAVKTFIYGTITLLLGYVERILDARHRTHGFGAAILYVIAHANVYRIFAWALGISMVFAIYFAMFEIDKRLGKGELRALFFDSPKAGADSSRHPGQAAALN